MTIDKTSLAISALFFISAVLNTVRYFVKGNNAKPGSYGLIAIHFLAFVFFFIKAIF